MDEELTGIEQNTPDALIGEVFDWIESFIMAFVCVILIFTFVGRLVGVVGISMLDTLHDRERLVVTRLLKPQNGDIVVASKPNAQNEPLIKRLIAVGGQTIDMDFENGKVLVDGEVLEEDYVFEAMDPDLTGDFEYPLTVPQGHVFLMGDNRNNSWDSRYEGVGFIDERHILGKVLYRVFPLDAIGNPYKRN